MQLFYILIGLFELLTLNFVRHLGSLLGKKHGIKIIIPADESLCTLPEAADMQSATEAILKVLPRAYDLLAQAFRSSGSLPCHDTVAVRYFLEEENTMSVKEKCYAHTNQQPRKRQLSLPKNTSCSGYLP